MVEGTTADVSSPRSSAQHVVGVDVATEAVRTWLNALCRPDGEPFPSARPIAEVGCRRR